MNGVARLTVSGTLNRTFEGRIGQQEGDDWGVGVSSVNVVFHINSAQHILRRETVQVALGD